MSVENPNFHTQPKEAQPQKLRISPKASIPLRIVLAAGVALGPPVIFETFQAKANTQQTFSSWKIEQSYNSAQEPNQDENQTMNEVLIYTTAGIGISGGLIFLSRAAYTHWQNRRK